MKIKVKNEMDKIKLKLNHRELVLLSLALDELGSNNNLDYKMVNYDLFDRDEFENQDELQTEIQKIKNAVGETLNTIHPF